MIVYLSVGDVVEINRRYGGPGAGVRDFGVVEGAVARPRSGYGDVEAHPSIWDKAAVLLHGLARTQGFFDGNKRTAWLVTKAFLELNAQPLVHVPDITAEAYVLSVSAGLLSEARTAEWLRVYTAPPEGPVRDPRVDFVFLAKEASGDSGVVNVVGGQLGGVLLPDFPATIDFAVVARFLWTEHDAGRRYFLRVTMAPQQDGAPPVGLHEQELEAPVRSGHDQYPGGLMPTLIHSAVEAFLPFEAPYEVAVYLDDTCIARLPFRVARQLTVP